LLSSSIDFYAEAACLVAQELQKIHMLLNTKSITKVRAFASRDASANLALYYGSITRYTVSLEAGQSLDAAVTLAD
jgi:hypothetical protein